MTERRLNLALQGGGSHGAFTWGVLDRLLQEEGIVIDGISGTGSGATNGALLLHGYAAGGREGARAALDKFWTRLSEFTWWGPVQSGWFDRLLGNWNLDNSVGSVLTDLRNQFLSPYQSNPLNLSPLRFVLEEIVDVERIRRFDAMKLFIAATNVETGKVRIFERHEVSIDALLAATCLPQVAQAVVIEGKPYWDGGYMGNPPIHPLIYGCDTPDVAIVQLDPINHEGVPRTASEIIDRLNEITFNANLMREMRAIAFAHSLIEQSAREGYPTPQLKRMFIHMIGDEAAMRPLGFASKFNTDLNFLHHLKALGAARAAGWLADNVHAIGERSSIDLRATFL